MKYALLVIDCQEKLFPKVQSAPQLLNKLKALIESCSLLNIPIQSFEQYPKGLGKTIPELNMLGSPIEKTQFSCCSPAKSFLKDTQTTHVLLAGIETHVCVYQSAIDLLENDIKVSIVVDATSSRNAIDSTIALQSLSQKGCELTTVERIVFQLLKSSENPQFKQVQKALLSCG